MISNKETIYLKKTPPKYFLISEFLLVVLNNLLLSLVLYIFSTYYIHITLLIRAFRLFIL